MSKNLCNKTRDKKEPYEVRISGGWTRNVLKKRQFDDEKPYARRFCFVTSPYCPEGEYGDVYVKEIKSLASKIK